MNTYTPGRLSGGVDAHISAVDPDVRTRRSGTGRRRSKTEGCATAPDYGVAMNVADAIRVASAYFAERFDEVRTGEWVLTEPREHPSAWTVGYQTRAFLETGSVSHSLAGNGPLVIPSQGNPLGRLGRASPSNLRSSAADRQIFADSGVARNRRVTDTSRDGTDPGG
ncbi:MAG: YrhB domain-containing protein [Marmoricola sp.]